MIFKLLLFTKLGYREGVDVTREAKIQQGFDQGFLDGSNHGFQKGLIQGNIAYNSKWKIWNLKLDFLILLFIFIYLFIFFIFSALTILSVIDYNLQNKQTKNNPPLKLMHLNKILNSHVKLNWNWNSNSNSNWNWNKQT